MPEIIEIPPPETADDAHWQAYARLVREYNKELIGGPEWNIDPADTLIDAKADSDHTMRRFLALVDGEAVGWANTQVNHVDAPEAVTVFVGVSAAHRGRGIGRALAERLREETAGFERHTAWIMCPLPGADDEVLIPSNGIGKVASDLPAMRLAASYGLKLGQTERVSRYDFARPAVDPAEALAEA